MLSRLLRGVHLLSCVSVVVLLLVAPAELRSQPDQWTWVGGSHQPPLNSLVGSNYGTRGVPDPANTPGAREQYQTWTDEQGNFWLFGGYGMPNDLWKYDPTTGNWAWMNGAMIQACTSNPCPWWPVYGTVGVADPGNAPANRLSPVTFAAPDGNLWLFGGSGLDSKGILGDLNDLWRYDPIHNVWTWISGGNTVSCSGTFTPLCGVPANYGTKGVAAKSNTPGGIEQAVAWSTPDGKLWVYGGRGFDAKRNFGYLDDLWSYCITTGMWTWVSGSGAATNNFPPVVSGTRGVPAVGNTPGLRLNSASWTDQLGNLWLFSGSFVGNDLWRYDPKAGQWAWISGTSDQTCAVNNCPPGGVYGTQGIASPSNTPGLRTGEVTWTAPDGTFWMYGGLGADSVGEVGFSGYSHTYLNDLWQFDPQTSQWTWVSGNSVQACQGIWLNQNLTYGTWCWTPAAYGARGTADVANSPGSRIAMRGWRDLAGNLWLQGGDVFLGLHWDSTLIHADLADTWKLHPASALDRITAAPKISVPSGIYASAQTVMLTDSDSGAAIYYTTDGTSPTQASQLYTGPISISQNAVLKAIAIANGAAPSAVAQATYVLQWSFSLVTAAGSPATLNIPQGGSGTFTVAANPVLNSTFPAAVTLAVSGLPAGATASFNPSTIAQGASRSTFSMAVHTTAASARNEHSGRTPLYLCIAGLPLLLLRLRPRTVVERRSVRLLISCVSLAIALGALSACGGAGASSGGPSGAGSSGSTPRGIYPLLVTASCGKVTATVTLTAQVE